MNNTIVRPLFMWPIENKKILIEICFVLFIPNNLVISMMQNWNMKVSITGVLDIAINTRFS
ncbi:hypothetical protein [Paludibacterium paludis]|uniref:hypothetical protein n=1 Tax=Paludibacterium paludis TaxID=1225769 RepID=UPI001E30639A|nr:hypothetical protein [Paludibacterium paludis]